MRNTTNTSAHIEQSEKLKATPSAADLDMRDYFAAKAMQKTFDYWMNNHTMQKGTKEEYLFPEECSDAIAVDAYAIADAMLAERAK